MSQVRTSIYFDSELFDQIHIFADLAGQSLKDFVNDAAIHYIETLRSRPCSQMSHRASKPSSKAPERDPPHPFEGGALLCTSGLSSVSQVTKRGSQSLLGCCGSHRQASIHSGLLLKCDRDFIRAADPSARTVERVHGAPSHENVYRPSSYRPSGVWRMVEVILDCRTEPRTDEPSHERVDHGCSGCEAVINELPCPRCGNSNPENDSPFN